MLFWYASRDVPLKMSLTKVVVNSPSCVRKAPMRRAPAGTSRNASAQAKKGATPSQTRDRRRPTGRGRTASIVSAVVARRYPPTADHPSAMTCVAASFCSGVGNWMLA
jgi:hypothetical protein